MAAILYRRMSGALSAPKDTKQRRSPRPLVQAIVQRAAAEIHTLGPADLAPIVRTLTAAAPACWAAPKASEAWLEVLHQQEQAALATLGTRVQALSPSWRQKFWHRTGELRAWFHGPPHRTSTGADALDALQQTLIESLLLNGACSAAQARALTRTWPDGAAAVASSVTYAWQEAWEQSPTAGAGARPRPARRAAAEGMSAARAAVWARFVTETLAATPTGSRPEEAEDIAAWRRAVLAHCAELKDEVPEAQQVLDAQWHPTDRATDPLSVDVLEHIPWLTDHTQRPPAPDAVRQLVARLPMAALATPDDAGDAMIACLEALVQHPAVGHTAMLALWATWPSHRLRLVVDVATRGESWWADPAFVTSVGATIVAHPLEPDWADAVYLRILTRTRGVMDVDTWVALLAYVTAERPGSPWDARGLPLLQGMAQFPTWHPSAHGLEPLLLHQNPRFREWAQLALAGPLAQGPRPSARSAARRPRPRRR